MPSAGKLTTDAQRGKKYNQCPGRESVKTLEAWCQARENAQPARDSARKLRPGPKQRKTCSRYQAWENMQPVPSAPGKHASGVKRREKTCNRCQARENMQLMPSAGKSASWLVWPCSWFVKNRPFIWIGLSRDCVTPWQTRE